MNKKSQPISCFVACPGGYGGRRERTVSHEFTVVRLSHLANVDTRRHRLGGYGLAAARRSHRYSFDNNDRTDQFDGRSRFRFRTRPLPISA